MLHNFTDSKYVGSIEPGRQLELTDRVDSRCMPIRTTAQLLLDFLLPLFSCLVVSERNIMTTTSLDTGIEKAFEKDQRLGEARTEA